MNVSSSLLVMINYLPLISRDIGHENSLFAHMWIMWDLLPECFKDGNKNFIHHTLLAIYAIQYTVTKTWHMH